jgi:sigma-E factor negative regulatory protein RseA
MNYPNPEYQELISALIDGQVQGEDFNRIMALMNDDRQALDDWHVYHLVGDLMRAGEHSLAGHCDEKLLAGIRNRLKAELPQAPNDLEQRESLPRVMAQRDSANQANFYWKVTASVASLMTVAVLGWQLLGRASDSSSASQLAKAEVITSPKLVQGMIRDPELDKLLEAHRLNGGISALQLPAGFVRNATFDKSSR